MKLHAIDIAIVLVCFPVRFASFLVTGLMTAFVSGFAAVSKVGVLHFQMAPAKTKHKKQIC
jgi:uncharacterized membrane protein